MAKQKGDPRWPVYPDGLMNVPINGDENNLAAIAVEVERTRKPRNGTFRSSKDMPLISRKGVTMEWFTSV